MPYANISASITDADMTVIRDAIKLIRTKLPFLINLTDEERRTIYKMGSDALDPVTRTVDYEKNYPQFIPGYVTATEFEKDYKLNRQLSELFGLLNPLVGDVDDTMMATGSELMDFFTAYYSSVQEAARRNVPGAEAIYNDLKTFFEKSGVTPPTPPTP